MRNKIVILNYVQDFEDAFMLDCSKEDLATNKEAKLCYGKIRKIRRRTNRFYKFLCKIGVAR